MRPSRTGYRVAARLTVFLVAIMASLGPVRSDDGLTPLSTSISDAEIGRRLDFLESRLDETKLHGQAWFWSWMAINVGSTGGNAYAASTFDNHDDRVNAAVAAGQSTIGIIDLLARPLEARYGADRIRPLPQSSRQEKILKLRAAEAQLQRNAQRASQRWSPVDHAGNAALALAGGLTVGLYGNPSDGVISGVSSLVGGWINLLSAPWQPEDDWQDYQAMISHRALMEVHVFTTALSDGAMLGVRVQW
ncbi:MAG: hypothetical protein H6905_06630 [Hyphomicrobiales bacterium]|nr:hypothetical protein [Hyphomicrobiales bacterium]